MKLIIRSVTFECLGENLLFDLTMMIDEAGDQINFIFRPSSELTIKYAIPESGFNIETDMKKNIRSLQIIVPNAQLTKELTDCIKDFIRDYKIE